MPKNGRSVAGVSGGWEVGPGGGGARLDSGEPFRTCPRSWSSPFSDLEPERVVSSGGACLDLDFRKISLVTGWLQGERREDMSGGDG